MKIKNLTYHRNGVAGIGFYSCEFYSSEDKQHFLATFETVEFNESAINISSCRVLSQDTTNNWRGDSFAYKLDDHFKSSLAEGQTIYDLTTNRQKYMESIKNKDPYHNSVY